MNPKPEKELMTPGAERILRWSFLIPLVLLVAVLLIGLVVAAIR